MEVVASLSQVRTAAAQCGLFTHKSVPVIFEPPCMSLGFKRLKRNFVFYVCCTKCPSGSRFTLPATCQWPDSDHVFYIFMSINCNSVMSYANSGEPTEVTSVRGRLQPLRDEGGRRQADESYSNDVEILWRAKTRK